MIQQALNRAPVPENGLIGKGYQPYLKTHQALGTSGVKSRILGRKSGRIHHLLSQVEVKVFRLLEWSDLVTDIREQFALDPAMTIRIAEAKKFKHPTVPATNKLAVMTTDFLVTLQGDKHEAISVKLPGDLAKSRTLEKAEIEKEFWRGRGIPWRLVTPGELPAALCANLDWLYGAPEQNLSPVIAAAMEDDLLLRLARGCGVAEACSETDRCLRLEAGTALNFLRLQLRSKRWRADLTQPLLLERNLRVWK